MNLLKENLDIIRQNLAVLQNTYNVKKIGIFGSFAKGKQKKNSDIDIIVEFSDPIGFFTFIELEDFLEKLLRKKIDLATSKSIKSHIKQSVLKETVYV